MTTETCANCSFPKDWHTTKDLWCNANGWKFKPQNQSPERIKVQDTSMVVRGIFDVSDLNEEIENGTNFYAKNDEPVTLNSNYLAVWELRGKKEERQRIKAEVEKVLDEMLSKTKFTHEMDLGYKDGLMSLKKRLGIK